MANRTAGIMAISTAFLVSVGAAFAADPEPIQRSNASTLWFENWGSLYNTSLNIVAPDGVRTDLFFASGSPTVYLRDLGTAVDGAYRYELRAATTETQKIVNPIDQGRGDAQKSETAVPFYTSGMFVVASGVIVIPEEVQEGDQEQK